MGNLSHPEPAVKPADSATLTATEAERFKAAEATIESGRKAFVEVGNALLAIREGRLYRATHETFAEYLKERWNLQTSFASKLIGSSQIVNHLENASNWTHFPLAESQVRPLLKLSDPSEEDQRVRVLDMAAVDAVWEQVVENAPKDDDGKPKITAKLVAEEVKKYTPPPGKKSKRRNRVADSALIETILKEIDHIIARVQRSERGIQFLREIAIANLRSAKKYVSAASNY